MRAENRGVGRYASDRSQALRVLMCSACVKDWDLERFIYYTSKRHRRFSEKSGNMIYFQAYCNVRPSNAPTLLVTIVALCEKRGKVWGFGAMPGHSIRQCSCATLFGMRHTAINRPCFALP